MRVEVLVPYSSRKDESNEEVKDPKAEVSVVIWRP